jgi:hypothetical protein
MIDTYTKHIPIDAPWRQIEQAVRTVEGLRGWWTPIVCGSAAPGGELHFGFAGVEEQIVMRVEPSPTGVRWRCVTHAGSPFWRGSVVTFAPSDGGLDFRHDGVPRELVQAGWERFLRSLAGFVERGEGAPFGDEALAVARAYHRAWAGGDHAGAAALLAGGLEIDVPLNTYATKEDFVAALSEFGGLVERTDLVAELARGSQAIQIYDMTTEAFGTIRIAEHFTVADGLITHIRHVHDTAALRAAMA